jgi:hypothetical protein
MDCCGALDYPALTLHNDGAYNSPNGLVELKEFFLDFVIVSESKFRESKFGRPIRLRSPSRGVQRHG